MIENDLRKLIRKYDKDAKLKKDSPTQFRIFLFSNRKRYPILNAISKNKTWEIEKISDYEPLIKDYPRVVIRLRRLRIWRNKKKE